MWTYRNPSANYNAALQWKSGGVHETPSLRGKAADSDPVADEGADYTVEIVTP